MTTKPIEIYDEFGNLSEAWYASQRAALRVFQGSNGLWYAATEDAEGFHRQGIGMYESATEALRAAREYYTRE